VRSHPSRSKLFSIREGVTLLGITLTPRRMFHRSLYRPRLALLKMREMIEKESVQDLRGCPLFRLSDLDDDGVLRQVCLTIYWGVAVPA
jgi:hypothetical protein